MSRYYQPRFVNYARVHNMTPEAIHARDLEDEGNMLPFMLWIQARIGDFRSVQPGAFMQGAGNDKHLLDHPAFDRYLDSLPVNT